jgi:hypothetical protein
MSAEAVLADLLACGIEPSLSPTGNGIEVPAGRLTAEQRRQVVAHKAELIDLLQQYARLTDALLIAAMRACDHWNDSPAAREQMRRECLATPRNQQRDLLKHFRSAYGSGGVQ